MLRESPLLALLAIAACTADPPPPPHGMREPDLAAPSTKGIVVVHVVAADPPQTGASADPTPGRPRYQLVGHRVTWVVDGQHCADAEELRVRLAEHVADPAEARIDPTTGRAGPPSLRLAPHPGVFYADLDATREVARAAGFRDIELWHP